jgi:hypothetical protein
MGMNFVVEIYFSCRAVISGGGGVNKMCLFVSILPKFNSTCLLLTQLTAKVSARLAGNFLHLLL